MRAGNQRSIISWALLIVLFAGAALPFPAMADEGLPPPPDAPVVDPGAQPTEPPPAATEAAPPAPADTIAAQPVAVDPAASATPASDSGLTVPQILEAAPDGTQLMVTDGVGTPVPLATAQAAAAIVSGDPVWCPSGHAPGDSECTASHSGFNWDGASDYGLLWDLRSQSTPGTFDYQGPGTIYISQGNLAPQDAGTSIFIDHNLLGLTDLTLQGGWDFGSNTLAGSTTFNLGAGNGLYILDWGEGAPGTGLTLRDITVTGDGLYIVNSDPTHLPAADVTLERVHVSNTAKGALIRTLGYVSVSQSHFDGNDPGLDPVNYPYDATSPDYPYNNVTTTGLYIQTGGNVTLNDITANDNHGSGLEIYDFKGTTPKAVLIQNSTFNSNTITDDERLADDCCWALGWGFVIGNGASVPTGTTLSNVESNWNTRGSTIFSGGDLSISNSQFDNTPYASPASLTLWSGGVVTLNGISASNNLNGDGVDIFGSWNGGDPTNPLTGSPALVQVLNSTFSGNGMSPLGYDPLALAYNGLFAVIGSGGATVSGSIFFNNTGYGIGTVGAGTVTEYGNVFSGNVLGDLIVLGGGTLVRPIGSGQLPGPLPQGWTFVDAMNVVQLGSGGQIAFNVPAGATGTLKVLAWNGTGWVDVASSVNGSQVFFTPGATGIFVLVSG